MLLTKEDKDFIKEKYSWLTICWDNLLKWVINFSASYDEVKKIFTINWGWENLLKWKYEIEVRFFQNKFPEVFEINWNLKRGMNFHIYEDWKFCLTHTLYENKYKNKTFQFIIEELIIPFLYNQSYNIKHWKFLWEYWHWIEWTFEYMTNNNISKNDYLLWLSLFKKELGKLSIKEIKNIFYSNNKMEDILNNLKFSSKAKKWFKKLKSYVLKHTKLFTKI